MHKIQCFVLNQNKGIIPSNYVNFLFQYLKIIFLRVKNILNQIKLYLQVNKVN